MWEKVKRDIEVYGGEIIKFHVSKGTNGAYIVTNSSAPDESEFLLSRNCKYTIKNVNNKWEITINGKKENN